MPTTVSCAVRVVETAQADVTGRIACSDDQDAKLCHPLNEPISRPVNEQTTAPEHVTVDPPIFGRFCSKCEVVRPRTSFSPGCGYCKKCRRVDIRARRAATGRLTDPLPHTHAQLAVVSYEMLCERDGEWCQLCGARHGDARGGKLHIDHNHKTGAVRGLLCRRCNMLVGWMRDSPEFCLKAREYLLRTEPAPLNVPGICMDREGRS